MHPQHVFFNKRKLCSVSIGHRVYEDYQSGCGVFPMKVQADPLAHVQLLLEARWCLPMVHANTVFQLQENHSPERSGSAVGACER
jgi:hypothetical protein